jgi:hypothetical protein
MQSRPQQPISLVMALATLSKVQTERLSILKSIIVNHDCEPLRRQVLKVYSRLNPKMEFSGPTESEHLTEQQFKSTVMTILSFEPDFETNFDFRSEFEVDPSKGKWSKRIDIAVWYKNTNTVILFELKNFPIYKIEWTSTTMVRLLNRKHIIDDDDHKEEDNDVRNTGSLCEKVKIIQSLSEPDLGSVVIQVYVKGSEEKLITSIYEQVRTTVQEQLLDYLHELELCNHPILVVRSNITKADTDNKSKGKYIQQTQVTTTTTHTTAHAHAPTPAPTKRYVNSLLLPSSIKIISSSVSHQSPAVRTVPTSSSSTSSVSTNVPKTVLGASAAAPPTSTTNSEIEELTTIMSRTSINDHDKRILESISKTDVHMVKCKAKPNVILVILGLVVGNVYTHIIKDLG